MICEAGAVRLFIFLPSDPTGLLRTRRAEKVPGQTLCLVFGRANPLLGSSTAGDPTVPLCMFQLLRVAVMTGQACWVSPVWGDPTVSSVRNTASSLACLTVLRAESCRCPLLHSLRYKWRLKKGRGERS